MSAEITVRGDIRRMRLRPGDVVVISIDRNVDVDLAERLRNQAQELFPGHKIAVLSEGIELHIQETTA